MGNKDICINLQPRHCKVDFSTRFSVIFVELIQVCFKQFTNNQQMLLQMRKQANISSFTTTEYLILDMYIWSQANQEPQIVTVGICAGNTEIRALFQHEENHCRIGANWKACIYHASSCQINLSWVSENSIMFQELSCSLSKSCILEFQIRDKLLKRKGQFITYK